MHEKRHAHGDPALERASSALGRIERTVRRCVVCGSREVSTDEVEEHGWLLLGECRHCDHRWTQSLPAAPDFPIVRRVASREEVASAA